MWSEARMKHLMYGISVVMLLVGVGLTVIGTWLDRSYKLTDYMNDSDSFRLLYIASYSFVSVGPLIIPFTIVGICGTVRRSVRLLYVFLIGFLILSTILLAVGVYNWVQHRDAIEAFANHLRAKFVVDDDFRKYMKNVHTLNCCGSIGYSNDFLNTCTPRAPYSYCAFPTYLQLKPYIYGSVGVAWAVDVFM
ncbi:CD9 antigen-like, partial [Haliotis rufescens]|uniref:CD9 antigen-like n=1 Tax=Haliotis rufescens TaxID=6454 RepID=UPI00201EAE32